MDTVNSSLNLIFVKYFTFFMYTFTKKIRIIIHPIEILHKKNNFVLFGRFLAVDDTRIEPAGSVPVD